MPISGILPHSFPFPLGCGELDVVESDNSLEAGLYHFLSNHPVISGLISDRTWPYYRPRVSELPAIVYTISDEPVDCDNNQAGISIASVELDCWAEEFDTVVKVANATRRALQAFRGYLGNVPVAVFYHGYDDEAQEPRDNSGLYLFCRTLRFNITHSVPIHSH